MDAIESDSCKSAESQPPNASTSESDPRNNSEKRTHVAPTCQDDACKAEAACRTLLTTLQVAKSNKQDQPNPNVNEHGEMTYRALRDLAASRKVGAEVFPRAVGVLVGQELARIISTGPNCDLHLICATGDGHDMTRSEICAHPELNQARVKVTMLGYLEAAEQSIHNRVDRIPDRDSRELVRLSLLHCAWPIYGVTLDDLLDYVRLVYPDVDVEPVRNPSGLGWEVPNWMLKAIATVVPVSTDPQRQCCVREAFATGHEPFPAKGEFASALEDLLSTGRVRVSEFRPVSDKTPGPYGPVFRIVPLSRSDEKNAAEDTASVIVLPSQGDAITADPLVFDDAAMEVFWGGTSLKLDERHRTILKVLNKNRGNVVPYADLLRAIKPKALSIVVRDLEEAPPEVRDVVVKIRKSFRQAEIPLKIKATPKVGYKLLKQE